MSGRLSGRIALVTGASRGIGEAVARHYAAEGAHVIALARTVGGLEDLDDAIKADPRARANGGTATLIPLDLSDLNMIDGLAAPLLERFGRIDVLVANAGSLGQLTPVYQFPPDIWEQTFALNLHANQRLLRAVHPLLQVSPAGRVIFVGSGASRMLKPYWGAYAVSKAALDALAKLYANECEGTNVKANVINPGGTRTDMRAAAFPGEDPLTLPTPDDIIEPFIALAEAGCKLNGEWIEARKWGK